MALADLRSRIAAEQGALDKEIALVLADLDTFLSQNLKRIMKAATKGDLDPATALNQIINEFKNAGLSQQIGNIAEIYGKELRRIQKYFVEEKLIAESEFVRLIDIDTVEALIKFRVEDIQNKAVQVIGNIRPIILENVILGTQPDFAALSTIYSSQLINYTKTELNTSILAFSRTITQVQAEAVGIDEFIYVGPYDGITRKFCQKVLTMRSPPIYTSEEIRALDKDSDSGLSVAVYGGGYNCRHGWSPVSKRLKKDLTREWEKVNYVDKKLKE